MRNSTFFYSVHSSKLLFAHVLCTLYYMKFVYFHILLFLALGCSPFSFFFSLVGCSVLIYCKLWYATKGYLYQGIDWPEHAPRQGPCNIYVLSICTRYCTGYCPLLNKREIRFTTSVRSTKYFFLSMIAAVSGSQCLQCGSAVRVEIGPI